MRITIAQLEAFAAVGRLGSVHHAAAQLHLAQPTVSLRLRDLEQALGAQLFERQGRGLRISQQGIELLEHASRVLEEVGKLRTRVDSGRIEGRVRLGVSETFAVAGLPALLKRTTLEFPGLRIELAIGPSPSLTREVLAHRLDMAIVVNPQNEARLRIIPLGNQPATWAASPSLQLPPTIRPIDVVHQTVLINPSPNPNWRQTVAWFGSGGLEPMHLSICDTVPSVIAHLVEEGLGISILPTRLIRAQLSARTLVALECRPAIEQSALCAVTNVGDREPARDAVIATTRRVLDELSLLEEF